MNREVKEEPNNTLADLAKWQPQHAELDQVAELFRELTGQEVAL